MVGDEELREVYFGDYCKKCRFSETKETDFPCDFCLGYPINLYTHKPVKFEEKSKK